MSAGGEYGRKVRRDPAAACDKKECSEDAVVTEAVGEEIGECAVGEKKQHTSAQ